MVLLVVEVLVPVLGLGVEKVEIVKFYKKEGERVEEGEPLVQVITSKITTDIEAPATGIVKKLYGAEGDQIPVQQKIAEIETEG
ncbi:MAG TPA: hypothetical protein DCR68_04160 [Coprothermobacter sp.]|nr:hypothetical protein [Coprothermobacter sp.]